MEKEKIEMGYYSVCTPSVFREYRLPHCEEDMNKNHKRKLRQLERIAEQYGTHVEYTWYERG